MPPLSGRAGLDFLPFSPAAASLLIHLPRVKSLISLFNYCVNLIPFAVIPIVKIFPLLFFFTGCDLGRLGGY